MSWTEERVEQLKTLWAQGYSASKIARTFRDVSRSAVLCRGPTRSGPLAGEGPCWPTCVSSWASSV